jgi:hypothetical protein
MVVFTVAVQQDHWQTGPALFIKKRRVPHIDNHRPRFLSSYISPALAQDQWAPAVVAARHPAERKSAIPASCAGAIIPSFIMIKNGFALI